MSEPTETSEVTVFPRKGEWIILVWEEEGNDWIFGGRAATERSMGETVRRLRREGWKVRIFNDDGDDIHSDPID